MSKESKFICENHLFRSIETPLSPARFKCKRCKKQNVHGYTNPDHVSNPFGYLYLVPNLCINCSCATKTCMWC